MSKTKKGLIISGSIIVLLVLLAVLFGTFFSLRHIYVDVASTGEHVLAYKNLYSSDIIKTSGIKKGKNVLFMDLDSAKAKLEKQYPYARFHFVRTFPNKLTIYLYERVPAFRVEVDGVWQIYDDQLKCLQISTDVEADNSNLVPVLRGVDLPFAKAEGEQISEPAFKTKLASILDGIYGKDKLGPSIMTDITLSYNAEVGEEILTLVVRDEDKPGTTLTIHGSKYLKEKITYALEIYFGEVATYTPDNYGNVHQGHLSSVEIEILNNFIPSSHEEARVKCDVCKTGQESALFCA